MTDLSANLFLTTQTELGHYAEGEVVTLKLGTLYSGQVTVFLPSDDDAALAVCDRLEAVLDNIVSAVRLRQQAREAALAGRNGAGASVEADRG